MTEAPVYYLSPHADDVAWSCAGSLATDVADGKKVTLVTAFLSGQQASLRRREDERAAEILGCSYLCLELPDAPERPEIRGALDLFMPFGQPHLGITNEVETRLLRHIKAPATLIAPLAVGGHIDHRIVHEAARSLAYHLGRDLRLAYYEDLPYSLIPYALSRRIDAMLEHGITGKEDPTALELRRIRAPIDDEITAYRQRLLSWPLSANWLPGLRTLKTHFAARRAVQSDVETRHHRPGFPPRLSATLIPVGRFSALRQRAISAYASQWPLFARSIDALGSMLSTYGRLGPASDNECYERLWFDDGVHGRLERT